MGPFVRGSSAPPDPTVAEVPSRGLPDGLPLGVLTGEALGEGPWLTNVLFRAFQAAASARGEALAEAYDLAPNED